MSPIFIGGRRILGSLSSAPTSGLTSGDEYYNSSENQKYIYSSASSSWKKLGGITGIAVGDPFNDNSAIASFQLNGNATSLSGTTFTGTLSGDNTVSNFSTGGQFGNYFNATGTKHLVDNTIAIAPTGSHSLSFWYKSNNTGQDNKRLLTIKGTTISSGWNNYNNSLGFYTGAGVSSGSNAVAGVTRVAQIPDASINNNVWHHLAYTISSTTSWNIYLDGTAYSGAVSGEGRSFNSGSRFAVTTYDGGDSYNTIGGVDQIRLFNRILTASEIEDLYNET
jgi:hypothetical protein